MGKFRKSAGELGRRLLGGIGAALVTVALVWGGFLEPLESCSLAQLFELRGSSARRWREPGPSTQRRMTRMNGPVLLPGDSLSASAIAARQEDFRNLLVGVS